MRGLIRFALKRRLIAADPSSAYELPPIPVQKLTLYTPGELAQLFADPVHGEIWRFLTHTALRAGEFVWLMNEDVVFGSDGRLTAVTIRRKVCPMTKETWQPKHDVERLVPLTTEAAAIVERCLAGSSSPWLFEAPPARRSRRPGKWDYAALLASLHARQQAAGVPRRGLHSFRHLGATFFANDSHMPIVQVQRMLGHRSLTTTQQYLHPRTADITASLARVDFSRLTEQSQPAAVQLRPS